MTIYLESIIKNLEKTHVTDVTELVESGGLLDESLSQAEVRWNTYGVKKLSREKSELFLQLIHSEIGKIWSQVSEMKRLKHSPQEICTAVSFALKQLNESSAKHVECKEIYQKKKGSVFEKFDKIEVKLVSDQIKFDSFVKPIKSEKTKKTIYDFMKSDPEYLKPKLMIEHDVECILKDSQKELFSGEKKPNNNSPSPNEYSAFKSIGIEQLGYFVGQSYGKIPAIFCKITLNRMFNPSFCETKNPKRDQIISSIVHGALVMSTSIIIPGWLTPVILEGTYAMGNEIQKLEKISPEQKKEMEYWWNKQIELYGEGPSFSGSLRLAQLPSDILHAINDLLTSGMIKLCDKLGITDENGLKTVKIIQKISKDSLKLKSQNNRGHLIERALQDRDEKISKKQN